MRCQTKGQNYYIICHNYNTIVIIMALATQLRLIIVTYNSDFVTHNF